MDFLYQADNGSLVNSTNVIVPIPSLLIPTNISSILVNVTGKNAGSVVVVLNSSDEAFARYVFGQVVSAHSWPSLTVSDFNFSTCARNSQTYACVLD